MQDSIAKEFDFKKVDLVLSDAVPDFIGQNYVDHVNALDLNVSIVRFCGTQLKSGGQCLIKVINGPDLEDTLREFEDLFATVKKIKPAASRSESRETFIYMDGFNQSKTENAVKLRELEAKFKRAEKNPKLKFELENEVFNETQELIRKMAEKMKSHGDVPGKKE